MEYFLFCELSFLMKSYYMYIYFRSNFLKNFINVSFLLNMLFEIF